MEIQEPDNKTAQLHYTVKWSFCQSYFLYETEGEKNENNEEIFKEKETRPHEADLLAFRSRNNGGSCRGRCHRNFHLHQGKSDGHRFLSCGDSAPLFQRDQGKGLVGQAKRIGDGSRYITDKRAIGFRRSNRGRGQMGVDADSILFQGRTPSGWLPVIFFLGIKNFGNSQQDNAENKKTDAQILFF